MKEGNENCCSNMSYYMNDDKTLLEYESVGRGYYLIMHLSPNSTHQLIKYCPWCGKKLPDGLDELWEEVLEKEFGITRPFDEDKEKIPPEFKTDEWWKKRGL